MTIYDDYAEYTATYKTKYGPMALVLIEVGSFWELYDCDQHRGADMRAVGELLNIQVSRKNKNIVEVSASNPEMAGFPSHALQKFMPILLDAGFTVILVGQVTPPPNPKRAVTQILSQGTCLDYVKTVESNTVCALHIESVASTADVGVAPVYVCGIAFVDVTTGACWLQESGGGQGDSKLALDHVYAHMKTFKPCEVVLTGRLNQKQQDELYAHLELSSNVSSMRVFNYVNVWDKQLEKPSFQNAFLRKAYPNTGMLTPLEFCNLERAPFAAMAFVQALIYVSSHNEKLIDMMQSPVLLVQEGHMEISYNAAQQLEMNHLLKYLNRSATPMGRRHYSQRMTLPSTSPAALTKSYDAIARYVLNGLGPLTATYQTMKKIHDVERIYRRCQLHQLNPCEWVNVIRSLEAFATLTEAHVPTHAMLSTLTSSLDMAVCEKTNMDNITANLFVIGRNPDADSLQSRLDVIRKGLDGLNNACGIFKLDCNDRDGHYLTCTSKRFKQFVTELDNDTKTLTIYEDKVMTLHKGMPYTTLPTGTVKLVCPVLTACSTALFKAEKQMHEMMLTTYKAFLSEFCSLHAENVRAFCRDVAAMDWAVTNARNAIEYGYVRPQLLNILEKGEANATDSPTFHAKGLRHPTVERLDMATAFVSNDVELSGKGMLLYGLNAAGKSTLMKAVGLCAIMAQSGMYVSCTSLELTPFSHVFTRIHRGDSLLRGQSTFMVEVCELRNILRRATKQSLVIGDELCSGTESASAIGIVAAGIQELCNRHTAFIFATHLHDLTNLAAIQRLRDSGTLRVCHLHVYYDATLRSLVYDRKLRDGQGATIYGIEVCKALDMGSDFLEAAHAFRREYLKVDIIPTQSRYNTNVYIDVCRLCHSRPACETHHIIEQHTADAQGHIAPGKHVHAAHNLAGLCEECHDHLHRTAAQQSNVIAGYVQTDKGIVMKKTTGTTANEVNMNDDNENEKQLLTIAIQYKKEGMSMPKILEKLKIDHDTVWTMYRLGKVIKSAQSRNMSS